MKEIHIYVFYFIAISWSIRTRLLILLRWGIWDHHLSFVWRIADRHIDVIGLNWDSYTYILILLLLLSIQKNLHLATVPITTRQGPSVFTLCNYCMASTGQSMNILWRIIAYPPQILPNRKQKARAQWCHFLQGTESTVL